MVSDSATSAAASGDGADEAVREPDEARPCGVERVGSGAGSADLGET